MVLHVCRAWRKVSRMGRGCMSVEKSGCRASGSRNRLASEGMAPIIRPRGEGVPLAVLKTHGDINQKYRPSKMLKSSRAGSMESSNKITRPACLHAAENGNETGAPFAPCSAHTISSRIAAAVHMTPAVRKSNSALPDKQLSVRAENRENAKKMVAVPERSACKNTNISFRTCCIKSPHFQMDLL